MLAGEARGDAGRVWMLDGQPQEVRDAVALASSVLMLNPRWQSNMFEAAYTRR